MEGAAVAITIGMKQQREPDRTHLLQEAPVLLSRDRERGSREACIRELRAGSAAERIRMGGRSAAATALRGEP